MYINLTVKIAPYGDIEDINIICNFVRLGLKEKELMFKVLI